MREAPSLIQLQERRARGIVGGRLLLQPFCCRPQGFLRRRGNIRVHSACMNDCTLSFHKCCELTADTRNSTRSVAAARHALTAARQVPVSANTPRHRHGHRCCLLMSELLPWPLHWIEVRRRHSPSNTLCSSSRPNVSEVCSSRVAADHLPNDPSEGRPGVPPDFPQLAEAFDCC